MDEFKNQFEKDVYFSLKNLCENNNGKWKDSEHKMKMKIKALQIGCTPREEEIFPKKNFFAITVFNTYVNEKERYLFFFDEIGIFTVARMRYDMINIFGKIKFVPDIQNAKEVWKRK